MRMKALVFLTLAVLIHSNAFSNQYKPYEDFKKSLKFKGMNEPFEKENYFNANAFAGKQYLEKVYRYIAGFEVDKSLTQIAKDPNYPQTANMFDNTAALLGFYFSEGWRGNTQKNAFERMRNDIATTLINSFLKREINSSLVELSDEEVKKQTKALATLLMASISYGHIVEPNKYQPQNYKDHKKPYYGFRLGQQAIRDGVLKSYMVYVINLKSEVTWFYDRINKYCPSSITNDKKVKLGGVDPDIDFNKIPPPVPTPVTGNFPISFMKVYRLMVNQFAGLGNVECLKLMAQLTQMKIELANAELILALLASNYSILNNQEKEWLR